MSTPSSSPDSSVAPQLLEAVLAIALEAGKIALAHRDGKADMKTDGSPVTAADRACDAFIRAELERMSDHAVLTEETFEETAETLPQTFWLVDPLDGTKEFLKGTGEFTVNIALVDATRPVLGVVYAPVLDLAYFAADGAGAWCSRGGARESIRTSSASPALRVALSRDHVGAGEQSLMTRLGNAEVRPMGSSLKFCLVAEGAADLYPRYGRTREWDTAAAQCVLECAGGSVIDADTREPLRYGKPDLVNPSFIAYADADALARVFTHV